MSQALSFHFSLTLGVQRGHGPRPSASSSVKPCSSLSFPNFRSKSNSGVSQSSSIKAMAKDSRENLDHLQRAANHNSQTKGRAAPVAVPVGLWDRFPTARTVQQMMETMERMMEDPFAFSSEWPSSSMSPTEVGGYRRGRTPWEIKEAESEYKMRFDMPGMTKEDVKVWVEEKMLVVKAEKIPKMQNKDVNGDKEEEEEGEWSAKSYGRYNSRIALPENVEFEKIKAEVKDGVLYITIPRASASSKMFDINVQ